MSSQVNLVVGLLGAIYCVMHSANVRGVDFNTIEQAWKNRQANTPSIKVEWEESRLFNSSSGTPHGSRKEVHQKVPHAVMYFSGMKLRFEDPMGLKPDGSGAEPWTSAFNGQGNRTLFITKEFPAAHIHPNGAAQFGRQIASLPLLFLYRGCESMNVPATLSAFSITGDGTPDDKGRVSLDLVDKSTSMGRMDYRMWLDSDLDYAPVQITGLIAGTTAIDVQLTLKRNRVGMIEPTAWSTAMMSGNGIVIEASRATVKKCSFGETLDETLFELPFPEGTVVTDMRVTPDKEYIVLKGGHTREVTRNELIRGATYQDLLRSPSGQARPSTVPLPPTASGASWLLWANIGIVVVLIMVWFKRAFRGTMFRR